MPYTVDYSFDAFRSQYVDLDPKDVEKARKSRDYLKDQITDIARSDNSFPKLYGGYQPFGSFARRTKTRKLDDIDMLLLLNGTSTQERYLSAYSSRIYVKDTSLPIWLYTDDENYLSSTKVLNKLKSSLSSVPNYRQSEIKRTGAAVVLNLTSYDWVFDIVPAMPISDGAGGVNYYLIPDGKGNWMRTDPRRDQKAITEANKKQDGLLLPLIRLIKYWNVHYYAVPRISSYYLETMLINAFKYGYPKITSIKSGIPVAFQQLATSVQNSCGDPKGLGPNLDADVSWEVRTKVRDAAKKMAQFAQSALQNEQSGDHKLAISWWKTIFSDFPPYG
jgi:hypothetical protein